MIPALRATGTRARRGRLLERASGRPSALHAEPEAVRNLVSRLSDTGGAAGSVAIHETHISWVFVGGGRAFKLRKPVVLPFLDYETPARRRAMAEAEIHLGRRLAPDLYRAVHALVVEGSALGLAPVTDERAVDYLVEMRAFAQSDTLAAAIRDRSVPPRLAEELGARLARFHAHCAARPHPAAAARARHAARLNVEELRELTRGAHDRTLDRLVRFLDAALSAHATELDARGRHGRLREGHGDLRAEHVLLTPRLAVIDPLEFDSGMRTLDSADELGFLVMDLLRLGAEPLAAEILRAYRAAGGDCGEDRLVWMFAVHRALVRAKVAVLGDAHAPDPGGAATGWLEVADRCAWRGRSIDALVICGGSASGKSHLTGALAARLGLPSLNTDVVRKELLGIPPWARAGTGAYTAEMSLRTYRTLGARTRALLADHASVLVDGTFLGDRERAAFLETLGPRRRTVFVQCTVPLQVARDRARRRAHSVASPSDATEEIVLAQGGPAGPFPDVAPAAQIILRTDRDGAAVQDDLDAMLDVRLDAGRR
ncbi:MAG TPA: AAA family ATPase [Solirubrobacteraceae bacterium]|nr:AAA family ATPase [Solirubrobacteraceae bacterium]